MATASAQPQTRQSGLPQATRPPVKIEFEDSVPPWVVTTVLFIVQWTAVYMLVMEYRSNGPLTRHTVVFIASMVGVLLLCMVLHMVRAIYAYIAGTFELLND